MSHTATQKSETGVLGVIQKINQERAGYLEQISEALDSGDDRKLKHFARKLCGKGASN